MGSPTLWNSPKLASPASFSTASQSTPGPKTAQATTGPVVMAATTNTTEGAAIGLQFHPESILSPTGPIILDRCITALLNQH